MNEIQCNAFSTSLQRHFDAEHLCLIYWSQSLHALCGDIKQTRRKLKCAEWHENTESTSWNRLLLNHVEVYQYFVGHSLNDPTPVSGLQRRRAWVRKVAVAKTCNFPPDNCQLPTEEICCSQFQLCPYVSPKWRIYRPKLCIFGRKLSDKTKVVWQAIGLT